MKLTRLRVAEWRQFREPFELAGLQPGLNLVTGANEAGKSTLAGAIRAAFFERHRSTSVDDLRPYGDSAAAPTVELDFEFAGTPYRLRKSFLHKKRCELTAGTRRLEGTEAEDYLAALLGFEFAAKGASREVHWGIPGLLWIEQGTAGTVHRPVAHAVDHLRSALNESLGEVASSGGDEVLAQVRAWRNDLLMQNGQPRGELRQAIDLAQSLTAEVAALDAAVAAYRSQVDQLRQGRAEHAAELANPPWVALREQQQQAQRQLEGIDDLARQLDRARDEQRRAVAHRQGLAQQLAAAEQQQRDLATREAALATATAQHEQAQAAELAAATADAAAAALERAARSALARARRADNRRLLARQLDEARLAADDATQRLAQAAQAQAHAATLAGEAEASRIDAGDLATLQRQQQRLRDLAIRQDAVATRLHHVLETGVQLTLDGQPVRGTGDLRLVAPAVLVMPGLGELHIAPGGSDLAELAREHGALADAHHALLQRLGLPSLEAAEARARHHAQKRADAAAAQQVLVAIAADGLPALQAQRDAALARQAEATVALAALAVRPDAEAEPEAAMPLADAERQHDARRAAAEDAGQRLQAARQALATAASRHTHARQERDALKAAADDPQRLQQVAEQRAAWAEASTREAQAAAEVAAIEGRIAAARPDILRQDVERYRRSADEAEREHGARDRRLAQLEATLQALGAQGLEEDLAARRAAADAAVRRRDELQRRADALELLTSRLDARRQALTRRLQAPLQKHLDAYLQLLFPDGRLAIGDDLSPGTLSRPGPRGPQDSAFDTLSYGAREQMGVISRLAYADLLQAAGRPTLVILDDALVHTDARRLEPMKRVLFDAARRHQVLLFTCHPEHWRDLGVAARRLDEAR